MDKLGAQQSLLGTANCTTAEKTRRNHPLNPTTNVKRPSSPR